MALLFFSFLLQSDQEKIFTNWLALDDMFVVAIIGVWGWGGGVLRYKKKRSFGMDKLERFRL